MREHARNAAVASRVLARYTVRMKNPISRELAARGLSARGLAADLLVPARTVQQWVSGHSVPSIGVLPQVLRALPGLGLHELAAWAELGPEERRRPQGAA